MAGILTKTKRKQVDKTQAIMLGFVIGASMISVFALVASKSFLSQATYLNKVSSAKEKARDQLKANKLAVSTLVTSYKSFAGQNPNLIGGSSTGSNNRDGDNGRLVLDALPSKYDFPALATSLEKMLTGYSINSISGSDDSTVQAESKASAGPVDMPFTMNVTTDYAGIQKLTTSLEKSIRPFQVQELSLSGTNNTLQVSITAKTFYQPEKDLSIIKKVVK